MGKTARAVHWTGHRHSARVPCPGAAGCVTLRFVRGFSSEVYAAEKTIQHFPPEAEIKKGGAPFPERSPRCGGTGVSGQLPASFWNTGDPAGRGAASAADSRERTAPIRPADGISMNAIPGREPFRRIVGQNCRPVKHGVWDSSPAGACRETCKGTAFAPRGCVRKESAAAGRGQKVKKVPGPCGSGTFPVTIELRPRG